MRRKSKTQADKLTAALVLVPTKELATQVISTLKTFCAFCSPAIRCQNITLEEDAAVTRSRLGEQPDVVVATPSRAAQWMNDGALNLRHLGHIVIDEADLVLSHGYEKDLRVLPPALTAGIQTIMVSATLRTETDELVSLFCKTQPVVLDLSAEEAAEMPKLAQYFVRTTEDEKFLIAYAIFKLQLVRGKIVIFVAGVDRCYRLKLFLEQFGIASCVVNEELPVNSRMHAVEGFNRGVYDVVIASDESTVGGKQARVVKKRKISQYSGFSPKGEHAEGRTTAESDEPEPKVDARPATESRKRDRLLPKDDPEFGVSRGIDFQDVVCVLNFDLPTTSRSYLHRTGRTARAGRTGMAISFYVPAECYGKHRPTSIEQCKDDERVMQEIKEKEAVKNGRLEDWTFDMQKLEPFRYRLESALKNVTRLAVREARVRELRNEIINSEKLQRHFEEHPDELNHLRHDQSMHVVRLQTHLRHVPEYLLPAGGRKAVAGELGYIGMAKSGGNKIRRAREMNKAKGKGGRRKPTDPLRTLRARRGGKK